MKKGLRTLLIDWELEAPGLDVYFYQDEALVSSREHLGLIDLLNEYKKRFWRFVAGSVDAAVSPEVAVSPEEARFLSERSDVPRFFRGAERPPATFEEVLAGLSRPNSTQQAICPPN